MRILLTCFLYSVACTQLVADDLAFFVHKAEPATETVILMHGLRGSSRSMHNLKDALLHKHYHVILVDYPSTEYTIQQLAEMTIPPALRKADALGSKKVHFVTHSLSSLILRYYVQNHECEKLDAVVMLSPPNHGSDIIAPFDKWKWFQNYNGPAGMQLDAHGDFIDTLVEPVKFKVGIIMSDVSLHPVMSMILPGNDDGRVTVESAKLQGMQDFIVVHRTHHYLMKNKKVIQLVLSFIKNSHF